MSATPFNICEAVVPRDDVPHVLSFCVRLNARGLPVRVPVRPKPEVPIVPNECFGNVQMHVVQYGGTGVTGWAIWEVPQLFIEAEFHAVWRTKAGTLIDVSQPPQRFDRILFLPDPETLYEGRNIDNVRQPLLDHPLVHKVIGRAQRRFEMLKDYPNGVLTLTGRAADRYREWQREGEAIQSEWLSLVLAHRRDTDPCICGGRRRFGDCHGPQLRGAQIQVGGPAR